MAYCTNCGCPLEAGTRTCPNCHAATQMAYAPPNVAQAQPARRNVKLIVIIASLVALTMAFAVYMVTNFGANYNPLEALIGHFGAGTVHKTTKDTSDTLYQVDFDLGDLVNDSSDTAKIVGDLHEFELRDKKTLTKNEHMAELVKYDEYDMQNRDEATYLEDELASTPIWYLSLYANRDNVGLDAVRKGASPEYVSFDGAHYGKAMTCEDAEELVSELYGYNGIALYKHTTDNDMITITGSAISEQTVTSVGIYGYESEGVYRYSSYFTTRPINENNMKFVRQFASYCYGDFLAFEHDDSLVIDVDAPSLRKLIDENYDPEAFNSEMREQSKAIGSSLSLPFDLSSLIASSSSSVASKLEPLSEFESRYYSEGTSHYQYFYTENADMAAAMNLDVDGDGKTDKLQGTLDVAPWHIQLLDKDYRYLNRRDLENGRKLDEVKFNSYISVDSPSFEDFAKLVKSAYKFDKILLHTNRNSNNITGIAIEGDSIASIYGYGSGDWETGIVRLEIDVFNINDDWLGRIYKDEFDESYGSDTLKYTYDEVYFG